MTKTRMLAAMAVFLLTWGLPAASPAEVDLDENCRRFRYPPNYDFCEEAREWTDHHPEGKAPDAVWPVRTRSELRDALCSAKGRQYTTIQIADDARINLTGERRIPLYGGVRLKGGRAGLVGGGLLFTRSLTTVDLFVVKGDDVRVSGLRFRGPSGSKARRGAKGTGSSARECHARTTGIVNDGHLRLMIYGNEFFHWTNAGVSVVSRTDPDKHNRQNGVWVAQNFFHHNQSQGGGYGVVISHGGDAVVEKNTFDHNRHAVASGGQPGTGYVARFNFVDEGAVKYCKKRYGVKGCWYEHHFDMHGTNAGDDRSYVGGVGGEYVEISYNTIRGEQKYGVLGFRKTRAAFDLRGIPEESAMFHHNVLAHDDRGEAIRETWKEGLLSCGLGGVLCANIIETFANRYDVDTRKQIGTGDFDGDGRVDEFQATGASWYYRSGGRTEWRFLNDSFFRLHELRFMDFDGDGRTDVVRHDENGELLWSQSATGAWAPAVAPTPRPTPAPKKCIPGTIGCKGDPAPTPRDRRRSPGRDF